MNCFEKQFAKSKNIQLLDKCIVLNQNYYHGCPPIIIAIRSDSYIVLNIAQKELVFEVPKSMVKVPSNQEFSMTELKQSTLSKIKSHLTAAEFQDLKNSVIISKGGI